MFLRPHSRTVDGKRHAYWSLVESVRTERGPRQRVVAYLGGLDEADRLGVQQAADPNFNSDEQPSLFDDDSTQPRYVNVDVSKVRVENCREFGGPWLAWQLIRRLELDKFLQETIPKGDEEIRWGVMSLVLVLARLCRPSSELHTADVTTVEHIVETMEHRYGKSDRIWVMDRGLVSEDNIAFLKEDNRRYILGATKSHLKKFEQQLLEEDWHTVHEGVEVKLCPSPEGDEETFILRRSRDRRSKDEAILRRFEKRIASRLESMQARCEKQRRDPQKVEREIGRLLGKNTRAAGLFDVQVKPDENGHAKLTWKKIADRRDLWKTLAALCEKSGLGHEPRRVLEELSQIRSIEVVLPTRDGIEIHKHCVTKPTEHQAILLHHLGFSLPSSLRQTEI